jgi:phage terminase small subunit
MKSTDFTKLTLRQRKYIDGVTKGMTRTEALRYAQYSETTRPSSVENASIKAAFARLVKRAVPAHVLAQRIAEGLNAEETKFFQKDGVITDQANVIAWSERREYAKLAAQWAGYSDAAENAKSPVNVGVQVLVEHIGSKDQATTKAE